MKKRLTHLDTHGAARMVDVGGKDITRREAIASARLRMKPETLALVRDHALAKGDVLAVARIAGIQAAKRCAELIPLCHTLPLDRVTVDFTFDEAGHSLVIRTTCATSARTGVEMEALTAASVAALTVYDMAKAVDRGMVIEEIALTEKKGGKSGTWRATPVRRKRTKNPSRSRPRGTSSEAPE